MEGGVRDHAAAERAAERFVLGASGHIAGVINPPAKKKRSHWILDGERSNAARRSRRVVRRRDRSIPGSWWTDWSAWLDEHGGKQVAAEGRGRPATYQVIEPAPGRYVQQQARPEAPRGSDDGINGRDSLTATSHAADRQEDIQ